MRYLISLYYIFIFSIIASSQNVTVVDIPTINQLPVNAIHRLFQDSEGYMWYGTVNGLCRDDGYNVQVFRSDFNTPNLLDNNLVECISEDTEGKIWFGTDKGAYILDKKNYHVSPLDAPRLKNRMTYRIDSSSDGSMWVSIAGSLLRYDSKGKLIKEYEIVSRKKRAYVSGFCENRNKEILISISGDRVYHLDRRTDKFIPFPNGLRNNNPTGIIQDNKHDYYWLLTWGDGIVRFDPSASKDSMYVYQELLSDPKGERNGIVLYAIQDDKYGYIWGTTNRQFFAFRPNGHGVLEKVAFPNVITSSNKMLNDVIKDRNGNIWVSAFDQPSFIISFQKDTPMYYPLNAIRKRVNYNPAVMALCDAGDGFMWISQERTGLFLYDFKNDAAYCYTDFLSTKGLDLSAIKQMAETSLHNGVWIAPESSSNIIYRVVRKNTNIELVNIIDINKLTISPGVITKLFEDSKNRLWIGTREGLYLFDTESNKFEVINSKLGFVTGFMEMPSGDVWVCTANKGIYKFSSLSYFVHYPLNYTFSSIAFTTNGTIWLGTEEGGIYAFYPHSNKLINYSHKCGMNGNQVNQITTDVFNHLWIYTNQKLIEFNPRNGSFRTYLTADKSIPLWRLIPTSVCKGRDGNIYFGGIPGMSSITPSNHLDSEASPVKTLITDVRVMGHSIIFSQKDNDNTLSNVQLNPEDRNIDIYFSSLDHRHASKIRYAYRLKGVDKDWIYTNIGRNSASYNYLEKGEYIFQVKTTDQNGLWSNEVTEIRIDRLPAFYETWWAHMLYALILLGAFVYLLGLYLKRIERKHNEMWSDSKEMIKMRDYLDSNVNLPEPEYLQLDKILLEKAVKVVEANFTEPNFDVSALADAMNMSRSTLTRKLKVITGKTPLDFIRNIKMKHAKHLLEDKDRSVTEIAATLGYFNRKYFTTCFKEEFGITPSEYQKTINDK